MAAAWRVGLDAEFYKFLLKTDERFTRALESAGHRRPQLLPLYPKVSRFKRCLKTLLDLEAGAISPVGRLRYLRPNPDGTEIYILIEGTWEVAFLLVAPRSLVAVWAGETPRMMRLVHGRGLLLKEPEGA